MASVRKKKKTQHSTNIKYAILTDRLLYNIAKQIPKDYHGILRELQVNEHDIQKIDIDYKDSVERRAEEGLFKWRLNCECEDKEEKEMVLELIGALGNTSRNDLVKIIKKEATDKKFGLSDNLEINEEILHCSRKNIPPNESDESSSLSSNDSDDNDDDDDDDFLDDNDDDDDDDDNDDEMGEEEENLKEEEEVIGGNQSTEEGEWSESDDESQSQEYLPLEKCIVAGVHSIDKFSEIGLFEASKSFVEESLTLKVVSKSPIQVYGTKKTKDRLELLLHDGVSYITGVAFEKNAQHVNVHVNEGFIYKLSHYKLKMANRVPSFLQLHLFKTTKIERVHTREFSDNPFKLFTIEDIKQSAMEMRLVSLTPVYITAVSPREKPKNKYLVKIMLKDQSCNKIVLNYWTESKNFKFKFKAEDCIDIKFVQVSEFSGKFELDVLGITKIIKSTEPFDCVISNNEKKFFEKQTMRVQNICGLTESHYRVNVPQATIENFKLERESDLVYTSCSAVLKHGKMSKRGNKLSCDKCKEYRRGRKMVMLRAEIIDYDNPGESVWVSIFDKCSRVILGEDYDDFKKYGHDDRVQILKDIKSRKDIYEFDMKVYANGESRDIILNDVTII